MTTDQEDSSPEDDQAFGIDPALEWKVYPFEDFERQMEEVLHRRMENTVDDEGAFFRNVRRLKQYFDEFYDEPESIRNHGSFVLALGHLTENSDSYDSELFGINHDGGLLVSEALQRAVHWYYAVLPRSEWGSNTDSVERIKDYARDWIANHPKNEDGEQGMRGNAG